ncbi:J domain-containing protein [Kordiimonas sp.]|uniref:J domain-containing protein n=1 Tax=Kordiimonas sp. TaxID=1970157 RepID=UPI003A90C15C
MLGWLILGVIMAGILLMLLNWWARADVKSAKSLLFWSIVALCGVFGLLLFATGKGFAAIVPAGFAAWRMFGAPRMGRGSGSGSTGASSARQPSMSRSEALDVLGLEDGATDDEVNAAYRAMMAKYHPDKGGNDWMASKLNEARKTLLGK